MLITNLLFFIAACVVLVMAGSWIVKSLTKIARFLKVSEFMAAFIILAFSTSIPELFVGISAALSKSPNLSLGNVIGSNIANLSLIMGIAIVLARGIKVESKTIRHDATNMFFVALLPLVLILIGHKLSRIDGAILLAVFIFYIFRLVRKRRRFVAKLENQIKRKEIVLYSFIFIIAFVALYFSAQYVVKYAELLAIGLKLPHILIGLFLIAIGTSLPELVVGIRAVTSGSSEMTLGAMIGSTVANSLLVLGVTAIICPIEPDFLLFFTSAMFMLIVVFLFGTMTESGKKLYLREGLSLIFLYIFFIMIEFYIHSLQ